MEEFYKFVIDCPIPKVIVLTFGVFASMLMVGGIIVAVTEKIINCKLKKNVSKK